MSKRTHVRVELTIKLKWACPAPDLSRQTVPAAACTPPSLREWRLLAADALQGGMVTEVLRRRMAEAYARSQPPQSPRACRSHRLRSAYFEANTGKPIASAGEHAQHKGPAARAREMRARPRVRTSLFRHRSRPPSGS